MSKMLFNDNNDRIKVIIRIRPKIEREYDQSNTLIRLEGNSIIVTTKKETKQYTFDYIASEDSSQSEIFAQSTKDICDSVLEGYNGTIFVYGQTGAGKTHTLLGPKFFQGSSFFSSSKTNKDANNSSIHESPIINRGYLTFTQRKEEEGRGILPRAIEYLFAKAKELKATDDQLTINFTCSFLEIYQEQISDLLDSNINKQVLIRDLSDNVLIENLTKWKISSPEEAYALVTKGNNLRHIALTAMNKESSRSHAVFLIFIESKTKTMNGKYKITKSVFHLIDLAGSERQKATECIGDRIKEAGKINKSLMQLSHVIKSLANCSMINNNPSTTKQKAYIPYRDSKLTHLLKDSLGGNAKTSIIANVSSSNANLQETMSTLLFAQSAKMIKNKAIINEEITNMSTQSHEELMGLKEKYDLLKSENYYLMNLLEKNTGSAITLNPSEFSKTIDCVEDEIENMIEEIAEKDKQIEYISIENEEMKEKIQKIYIEICIKEKELLEKKDMAKTARNEYDSLKEKWKTFVMDNSYHTQALKAIDNQIHVKDNEHNNTLMRLDEEIKESSVILTKKEESLNKEKEYLDALLKLDNDENKAKREQLNYLNELNHVCKEREQQHKTNSEYIQLKETELKIMKSSIEDKANELTQAQKCIESIISKRKEAINEKKDIIKKVKLSLLDKEDKLALIKREKEEAKAKIADLTEDKEKLTEEIKENEAQMLQLGQDKDILVTDLSSIQITQKESKNKNDILCERLSQLIENKNVNSNKISLLSKIKAENKKLRDESYALKKSYSSLNSSLSHLFGHNAANKPITSQVNITDLINRNKSELNEANSIFTLMTKKMKGVNDDNKSVPILTINQVEGLALYFEQFIQLNQNKRKQKEIYQDNIAMKDKAIAGMQRKMINNNVHLTLNDKRFSNKNTSSSSSKMIIDDIALLEFKTKKRKYCDYIPFDNQNKENIPLQPFSLSAKRNSFV